MKTKLLSLAIVCFTWTTMVAQETALVYSLPKTVLLIDVEYEEIKTEVGPFYQYSELYLGVKQPITKAETYYELNEIHVQSKGIADNEKVYTCQVINGLLPRLTLSKCGILLGVNQSISAEEPTENRPEKYCKSIAPTSVRITPFLEEQMLASSISKQAESTAKVIYHLRDSRIALLSGETEKMPADIATALNRLDEEEALLCSQFVGKVVRKKMHKKLIYIPTGAAKDSIIARFSTFSGVVDVDDLSGSPIVFNLEPEIQNLTISSDKKMRPSCIHYIVPNTCHITLQYKADMLVDKCISIAQLGKTLSLPIESIANGESILLDEKTGALLQITK